MVSPDVTELAANVTVVVVYVPLSLKTFVELLTSQTEQAHPWAEATPIVIVKVQVDTDVPPALRLPAVAPPVKVLTPPEQVVVAEKVVPTERLPAEEIVPAAVVLP
jgi:hypothetical protein